MAEEEYMIEREMEKREGGKNPPPKPDDKAHITVVIFFFFHISETHSYPQTYHSSAFGQPHIAMVILVKRLTFGPC